MFVALVNSFPRTLHLSFHLHPFCFLSRMHKYNFAVIIRHDFNVDICILHNTYTIHKYKRIWVLNMIF